MIYEEDIRDGVVKVSWEQIRDRVSKVEPIFARLVDELSVNKSFALFLVYLPYGALKGDTTNSYFPDGKGHYYRLCEASAPKELVDQLGYGLGGSPMGMVLEKQLEYFIDLKHKSITIPWLIYSPGQLFPLSSLLGSKDQSAYTPNGLLTVSSGARSTFMLPNIGCNSHHVNLKRDYNIHAQAPKVLYDHWTVFKEIVRSKVMNDSWRSCLLYFGEKWVNMLHDDPAWMKLKLYMHEIAWEKSQYERNRVNYDIAFSLIQEKRNLKPNPYLSDTARHLFATALGAVPGYAPSCNDDAIPLKTIQQAYLDSYGLKKYMPIVMQPQHHCFERDQLPIYYSLQNPATRIFSPKSRNISSTLSEMLELEHIMNVFCEELSDSSTICSDTVIGEIAKDLALKYYHNKPDRQRIVRLSKEMAEHDNRFNYAHNQIEGLSARFSSDAPFVRGCVSLQRHCD